MRLLLAAALVTLAALASAAPPVRIRPKKSAGGEDGSLLAPDTSLIDAPTAAVLDYQDYASQSRFFAKGGLLEELSFGVFQRLNIGASLNLDGIVGSDQTVRLRAPNAQVKYRFYDGERLIPALAAGYDGQGYDYSQADKKYNHRQRGFYVVASQELGVPGLMAHPSINISDFNGNSFCGSIPLSYNIQDKVLLMAEWDNINDISDSRFNSGLRVYVTQAFALDFAVRSIGQGGRYADGDPRGPERIVQLKYTGSF